MTTEDDRRRARRERIATAAVRLLSRQGMRALTHRAVDREAGLAEGSTSYYAPTRRALLELIVHTLAERSMGDARHAEAGARSSGGEDPGDPVELAAVLAAMVDALATRSDDMKARAALLLELDADDPLRRILAEGSPVRREARPLASAALAARGVRAPDDRADELFELIDALLLRRVIVGEDSSAEPILAAFLRGMEL